MSVLKKQEYEVHELNSQLKYYKNRINSKTFELRGKNRKQKQNRDYQKSQSQLQAKIP